MAASFIYLLYYLLPHGWAGESLAIEDSSTITSFSSVVLSSLSSVSPELVYFECLEALEFSSGPSGVSPDDLGSSSTIESYFAVV